MLNYKLVENNTKIGVRRLKFILDYEKEDSNESGDEEAEKEAVILQNNFKSCSVSLKDGPIVYKYHKKESVNGIRIFHKN